MILSDKEIAQRVIGHHQPMISPFSPEKVRKFGVSFGLSSYGYDVRLGATVMKPMVANQILDPSMPPQAWLSTPMFTHHHHAQGEVQSYVIDPGEYILSETVERFNMPSDVMGICVGKSTWARMGIIVNVTPLEPGWEGVLTLEICNAGSNPVRLYAGAGICQIIFLQGTEAARQSYADQSGKYMNQTGVTPPR